MSAEWDGKTLYFKNKADAEFDALVQCHFDEMVEYEIALYKEYKAERARQKAECFQLVLVLPFSMLFYLITFRPSKAKLSLNLFFLAVSMLLHA